MFSDRKCWHSVRGASAKFPKHIMKSISDSGRNFIRMFMTHKTDGRDDQEHGEDHGQEDGVSMIS